MNLKRNASDIACGLLCALLMLLALPFIVCALIGFVLAEFALSLRDRKKEPRHGRL